MTAATAVAAAAHFGGRIEERLNEIKGNVAPAELLAAGSAAIHQCLEAELERILKRRCAVPEGETAEALRTLDERANSGDLQGAPAAVRARVLGWAARLAALDPSPAYDAFLARARALAPGGDYGLQAALRTAALGDLDAALRMLRARDDPDSRTATLSLLLRADRRADALTWLSDLSALGKHHLSAIGWRNLAAFLMEEGRQADATMVLAGRTGEQEEACPDILYVRGLARAAGLYPDYARDAFRFGVVPPGVAMLEGPEAAALHAAAVADLERAGAAFVAIGLVERGRNARVCALALRLRWPGTNSVARVELEAMMAGGSVPPLDLVGLALEHRVAFDQAEVRATLDRAERFGGLDHVGTEARLALLQHGKPADFAAYLEANAARLKPFVAEGRLAGLRVEALAQSGDVARARQVLDTDRDLLGDDQARLSALVSAHAGEDPTEALNAIARRTGSAFDIENLCRALERAGRWAALLAPAKQLLELAPNTENLVRAVVACQRSRAADAELLTVLDCQPSLVQADRRLSLARAQALMGAGRIAEAAASAEALYATYGGADEAVAACNAAVLSGRWEGLHGIAADELRRCAERDPGHLAWVGMVCSERDEVAALALVREAAAREFADATTLLRCADVALRAGLDGEGFAWVGRAHPLSGADGPVRTVDRSDAVSVLLERAEQARTVDQLLSSGQIPLHCAAKMHGSGLVRLLVGNLIRNTREPDGRRRSVLPVRSGSRPLIAPSGVRRPVVDLTSLLLLGYLDALSLLDEAFEAVLVPWSTMATLRQEVDRVRHHQRSAVRQAARLERLLGQGALQRLPMWSGQADTAVEKEVGVELAGLLVRARDAGGRVVHPAPVTRIGPDWDAQAELGDLSNLLLTTLQFADLLRQRGMIDAEGYGSSVAVLARDDRGDPPGPAYKEGPLFLSWLAAAYLEPVGLLEALRASGLTVFVSDDIAGDASAHADYDHDAERMLEVVDRIRAWYAAGVATGKVHIAPRAQTDDSGEDDGGPPPRGYAEALREFFLATDRDGALVDDRFMLRHAGLGEGGTAVPLFGTLDLLRYLANGPTLSEARHWSLRHRLRAGGAACVPLDPEELQHHLGHIDGTGAAETAELRAIRESIAALRVRKAFVLPDEEPFLSGLTLVACVVVRRVWANESVDINAAQARADWVWEHVAPKAPEWWHRWPEEGRPKPSADVLRPALLWLFPLIARRPERWRAAREWLGDCVLSPWWADPTFRQMTVEVARARLLDLSAEPGPGLNRADVALQLLEYLPQAVTDELSRDAAFLDIVGLRQRLPLIGIGGLVFSSPALHAAARAALEAASATLQDVRHGLDIRLAAENDRLVIRW